MIVQLHDEPSADRLTARYVGFSEAPPVNAAQFVIIDCPSGRRFLGQVTGPNLNFNRNSLSPTDNTAINQAEHIASGRMARDVAVNEVFYYELRLLKEIVDGAASSVRVRPQISSTARRGTDAEIIQFLNLPEINAETQIGSIIDTEVPICISKRVLMTHALVAGSTGCGKSNTIANIDRAAINHGMAVIKFDHKPDYQNVHEPNDEGFGDHYAPLSEDIEFWHIGESFNVPGRKEKIISVPARDLDLAILAATIFYRDNEGLMRDAFYTILAEYAQDNSDKNWSMETFKPWLQSLNKNTAPGQPEERTLGAIKRRMSHHGRIPVWVDAKSKSRPGDEFLGLRDREEPFRVERLVAPGKACVIRVGAGAGDGRDYALLLSYILDKVSQIPKLPCPVLIDIDEAQDIFSASRAVRDAATNKLDEHVRKGRSKRIGFIFGVQSSESVPDTIMNNLNNRFIHRHNSPDELRVAASMATDEQRKLTATFSPGECLTFLFGANSIVHAQMRLSPFKLTKEEL